MIDNKESPVSISSHDLIAYVDGQLAPDRKEMVTRYLEVNADMANFVQSARAQNDALQKHFDPVLNEAIPGRLLQAVTRTGRNRRQMHIAATAMFLLGIFGGWMTNAYFGLQDKDHGNLGQRAALAYNIYAQTDADALDLASSDQSQVRGWIVRQLGVSITPPRLLDLGFELIGTRLMMGKDAPAGLLVYRRLDGRKLVLFLRTDMNRRIEAEPQFGQEHGVATAYWIQAGFGFSLSGPLLKDEMTAAASLVRSQWRS